jgi:meso-butanediol dehydrogenase/(S,S)-butanediol dehydrogenase/diacetyl reductase
VIHGPAMSGEVAFVTGAGSGIGAATARLLATRGADVALFDRSPEAAERTAAEIRGLGASTLVLAGDVSDDAAVARAVQTTIEQLGPLVTVVAAAGIEMPGTITDISVDDWRRVLDVNLTGVFLTARHTIPRLVERRGGAFVAVSSDVGFRGSEGEIAYSAAKHGVVGLVRCLAIDHGRHGVRANVVCPGFVATPMADRLLGADGDPSSYENTIPLGHFAQPEQVAKAIAHLCSPDASHTTGMLYIIDGGASVGFFSGESPASAP